ncbi:bifunctional adenosylcobinamide kinase/adenosylcobinamide-phosphate guanylyltransferase [Pararobbsia silviterrae]|uniref:Bifunctional adenosylcobalamin biosynthesis protein n=1 Tax=Pararobbsia silviterrae TaxID=1792498 RepID=A0A494Y1P8_9BURK|nr:bifunctional adenosylcobinamide kinase/adenosylcobinamide-phosphate guanylyltransferase [Pararobbsia silviterrae]RKP56695.1 bifunctional adenosylcobinamide kinase/adenosylcobinamide-phosphate guanylyltransferase [Pararobbsia silviterrae]
MSASPVPASSTARTVFVLGGARSGKSAYAERCAAQSGYPVRYIATATPPSAHDDPEFAERIAIHRARRPAGWQTVEAGADLASALRDTGDAGDACLIVDCLTLWLTGLFFPAGGGGPVADWARHVDAFDAALAGVRAPVYVISNEIGLGVVPLGADTRRFVDELGRINQRMAARCDEVVLMVAGLPMRVKP